MEQDRRIRKSKEALKQSLLTIMKRKPISKISIRELCEEADLNRSTFYANYNDINGLLEDIHNDIFYEMSIAIKSSLQIYEKREINKIHTLKEIIEYLHSDIERVRVVLMNNDNKLFEKHLTDYFLKYYEIDNKDLKKKYILLYHTIAGFSLIMTWIMDDCPCSSEQLAVFIYEMSKNVDKNEKISNVTL